MTTQTCIRLADPKDAPDIADIYAHYVLNTLVTFEVTPPSAAEISARMTQSIMWLVCETVQDHEVVGYAYARPYRPERPAYDVSVETSVYIRHDDRWMRKGIGRELVIALTASLCAVRFEGKPQTQRYHQALAIQSKPPHTPDEAEDRAAEGFYRALGFRHVGTLRKVGYKLGTWADVDFWQLGLAV